jgi:hypothetical protein
VHELTHALQDQHFDLNEMRDVGDDDSLSAITALIEGDASRVETAWVTRLGTADQRAYERQNARLNAGADFDEIPPVVRILFGAPYQFGPALIEVLRAEGGQAAIDRAFTRPPTTDEHLFDPATYLDDDRAAKVDEPEVPRGAEEVDTGTFGPLGWYVTLSEHIDAHTALRATDGWGGDAYVSYRTRDDELCTRIQYEGDTATDGTEMRSALTQWIDALPAGTATLRTADDNLLLESCDPGVGAKVATGDSMRAIALPVTRVEIVQVMVESGASIDVASCIADGIVGSASLTDLADPDAAQFRSPAGQQRIAAIAAECRRAPA